MCAHKNVCDNILLICMHVVFVLILTHFLSVCGYSFVYDDVQPVLHVHHLSAVIT